MNNDTKTPREWEAVVNAFVVELHRRGVGGSFEKELQELVGYIVDTAESRAREERDNYYKGVLDKWVEDKVHDLKEARQTERKLLAAQLEHIAETENPTQMVIDLRNVISQIT